VKRVTTISPERKSWWDSVDRLLSQRLIEKDDKPTGRIPQFRERTQDVFDETEQDPALIDLEWRNVSANRLPYYESFRHHDGLDMMPFIFGPAAKFPNKKEAAEGTVGDILTAYGFLRTTTDLSGKARRWEIAALFSELQPSLAVIENPDQLQKGLEWLEIQHMPIRQNRLFKKGILSRYWLMNGLARQHFASLDAAGFNPTLKNRWIANTVSESPNQPWFVPNADSRRRAKTNIDLVLARMRLQKRSVMSIYHTLDFWGRSKQPRALDGSLEEMAAKIGAEAALLRWNISRYLARQRITARLEELTVGEGIRALRRAAGLSPGSLAVAIGVDRRTLTKWELGERRVSNAYDRQALSAVLEAGAKWFDGSRTPLPRVLLDAAS
jgi:DNA-binding transcriptional regulator YiaG